MEKVFGDRAEGESEGIDESFIIPAEEEEYEIGSCCRRSFAVEEDGRGGVDVATAVVWSRARQQPLPCPTGYGEEEEPFLHQEIIRRALPSSTTPSNGGEDVDDVEEVAQIMIPPTTCVSSVVGAFQSPRTGAWRGPDQKYLQTMPQRCLLCGLGWNGPSESVHVHEQGSKHKARLREARGEPRKLPCHGDIRRRRHAPPPPKALIFNHLPSYGT